MSAINDALSKLAEQQSEQQNSDKPSFSRAKVDIPKSRPSRLVWAVIGFTVSLGIGAWAVSTGTSENETEQDYVKQTNLDIANGALVDATDQDRPNETAIKANSSNNSESSVTPKTNADASKTATSSNNNRIADISVPVTTRVTEPDAIPIYSNEPVEVKPQVAPSKPPQVTQPKATQSQSTAKPQATTRPQSSSSNRGSIKVQQVELSNYQLAEQSASVAEKALDDGNLEQAISAYQQALRYTPKDENTRRKLAALYYGSKRSQQAGQVLEAGIKLNPNSSSLRLAYADIFRKEKQLNAALSVLMYLPSNASIEYLATRAALAQQLKQQETAYSTYKLLTQRDPDNARWWLGYAMQQESYKQYLNAKASYEKSLSLVGLSSQSQAYARSRISFLELVTKGDNE